ncbi:retrotransposon ty1-copia subclass [Plasmopara halstedii]|uniref:Retrotransposon ty1-copia subclass n=1 Tax=Plasmopara halstedii TaxID=4781 RepID=A0A0P1B688_PLAHL|nr:retrotransposon ty1-copia subclass [Plasmopara halstedii]CEG50320.1 retrotransposon ty1-copia subclass [Plasmopara halstedii]|eukprot:XP_024586689.1 retrotransposon ty1-copia subclass [Plasmopara halstedii]
MFPIDCVGRMETILRDGFTGLVSIMVKPYHLAAEFITSSTQQFDKVERNNHVVVELVRAMLHAAGLGKCFWSDDVLPTVLRVSSATRGVGNEVSTAVARRKPSGHKGSRRVDLSSISKTRMITLKGELLKQQQTKSAQDHSSQQTYQEEKRDSEESYNAHEIALINELQDPFQVVALPHVLGNAQPIDVCADGSLDKYKARLVAKEFTQQYGLDCNKIFSSIVCCDLIRIILVPAVEVERKHLSDKNVLSVRVGTGYKGCEGCVWPAAGVLGLVTRTDGSIVVLFIVDDVLIFSDLKSELTAF